MVIFFDIAFNESFDKNLKATHYSLITGQIKGTSSEKLFQELSLNP